VGKGQGRKRGRGEGKAQVCSESRGSGLRGGVQLRLALVAIVGCAAPRCCTWVRNRRVSSQTKRPSFILADHRAVHYPQIIHIPVRRLAEHLHFVVTLLHEHVQLAYRPGAILLFDPLQEVSRRLIASIPLLASRSLPVGRGETCVETDVV
jgi:hypothetical protein